MSLVSDLEASVVSRRQELDKKHRRMAEQYWADYKSALRGLSGDQYTSVERRQWDILQHKLHSIPGRPMTYIGRRLK